MISQEPPHHHFLYNWRITYLPKLNNLHRQPAQPPQPPQRYHANDLFVLVENLAFVVDCLASAILDITFGKLANLFAFVVKNLALLVDLTAFQNTEVKAYSTGKLHSSTFGETDLAEDIAFAVNNLCRLVDLEIVGLNVAEDVTLIVDNFCLELSTQPVKPFSVTELAAPQFPPRPLTPSSYHTPVATTMNAAVAYDVNHLAIPRGDPKDLFIEDLSTTPQRYHDHHDQRQYE